MEIADWLRGLGLSQYEAAFRENSIDLEILRKLTSEDLKDLGVASVGHRRRLLAAIEELSSTGLATSAVAGSAAEGIAEATSAERRHLTVMIVDLVGSTALAARLDPEDMRDVLAAYHTCCAGLIASNGGFVAKYMGDGVLAYFGYPQAHEQDAENAVSAALAIVAAVPKLNTAAGAPLHARVGVATGIVVVGDLLGSGEAQERDVVGDTPNLAARLQGIAESDGVVIDEGTRELLGNLFELQDLGTRDLKGIARPARAWAALRASSGRQPLRGAARNGPHAARRAGRRMRIAAPAVGAGEGWRRTSRPAFRRGRDRQVATCRLAYRTPRRRTADFAALFLLSAAHRRRALSDHRRDGARREVRARRHPTSEARQARRASQVHVDPGRGRCAVRRDAVAEARWTLPGDRPCAAAAPAKNAAGARRANRGSDEPSVRC